MNFFTTKQQQPQGSTSSSGSYSAASAATAAPASGQQALSDLLYILLAGLLGVVLAHLPVLDEVLYPFKLFATFIHEWSHALITMFTGGHVLALRIKSDLSGDALSAGGLILPISSAGYLGTAIFGAILLTISPKRARRTLTAIGLAALLLLIGGSLLQGTFFSTLTWVWGLAFAAILLLIATRVPARLAGFFQQWLAVEICLTALDSLRQLVHIEAIAPWYPTDALNASRSTGLPPMFWALSWTVLAVVVIAYAAGVLIRRTQRRPLRSS